VPGVSGDRAAMLTATIAALAATAVSWHAASRGGTSPRSASRGGTIPLHAASRGGTTPLHSAPRGGTTPLHPPA
jgi:hypothetical protein